MGCNASGVESIAWIHLSLMSTKVSLALPSCRGILIVQYTLLIVLPTMVDHYLKCSDTRTDSTLSGNDVECGICYEKIAAKKSKFGLLGKKDQNDVSPVFISHEDFM
jgi:hypothetical protein